LKDIPLFGNLFKYSRKSVVKKDLVIFVTPRIIRNYIGNVDISEVSAEKAAAPAAAPEAKKVEQKPAAQAKPAAAPAKQQTAAQPSQKPEASKAPAAPAPAKGDSDWE
jgi:type IV pilus assembly protein PilQ